MKWQDLAKLSPNKPEGEDNLPEVQAIASVEGEGDAAVIVLRIPLADLPGERSYTDKNGKERKSTAFKLSSTAFLDERTSIEIGTHSPRATVSYKLTRYAVNRPSA